MALTTSKTYYRQGFGPFMPEVYISPYPYCLHCKVRQAAPGGKDWYKVCLLTRAGQGCSHAHMQNRRPGQMLQAACQQLITWR